MQFTKDEKKKKKKKTLNQKHDNICYHIYWNIKQNMYTFIFWSTADFVSLHS